MVQAGSIKKQAELDSTGDKIIFPSLDLELDLSRAQTFGMMVVSQTDKVVECEFRHLSLAEYLTALHVHNTGEPLKVKGIYTSLRIKVSIFSNFYFNPKLSNSIFYLVVLF